MKRIILALFAVTLFSGVSFASVPFKLSLWEKVALPPSDEVVGLEFGIGSYTHEVSGIALNWLYGRTDKLIGAQIAFLNFNTESVSGVQYGFFNKAKYVKGAQIGFINMTEDMYGVQIGLVNHIKTGALPWMVIFNAKF
ncbi:MAG: hypothetical protein LBU09_02500 [Endomicrobium sp.]|jgi:hypothetical protein|nr:hypothetical protein [Endomicrobium sp.]